MSSPSRPKIVILQVRQWHDRYYSPETRRELESFAEVLWNPYEIGGAKLDPEVLLQMIHNADALTSGRTAGQLTPEILDMAVNLKQVVHLGTHVAEEWAEPAVKSGIMVTNTGKAGGDPVAEHALALTLAVLRNLVAYSNRVTQEGAWSGEGVDEGHTLYHRNVGVVGLGNIGREYVRLLQPFNCRVLGYDPYAPLGPLNELDVVMVDLPTLFSTSDVIVIHAALCRKTRGMITCELLNMMKPGAVFINTARGKIVDYDALSDLLTARRIRAGIDVHELDTHEELDRFRQLPNLVLTPHIAGLTPESDLEFGASAVNDFRRYLIEGEDLPHKFTLERIEILKGHTI